MHLHICCCGVLPPGVVCLQCTLCKIRNILAVEHFLLPPKSTVRHPSSISILMPGSIHLLEPKAIGLVHEV